MPRYRYTGDSPRSIPALALELLPGQEFDSAEELNHADLKLLKAEAPKAPAPAPRPKEE